MINHLEVGADTGGLQVCSECRMSIPREVQRIRSSRRVSSVSFSFTLCPCCIINAAKEVFNNPVNIQLLDKMRNTLEMIDDGE